MVIDATAAPRDVSNGAVAGCGYQGHSSEPRRATLKIHLVGQDVLVDDYLVSAEEAAALLGISAKTLRQRLRDERPAGARQIPPQHGGNWFLRPSYVEELAAQCGRSIHNLSALSPDRLTSTHLPEVERDNPKPAFAYAVADPSHGTWSQWIPFGEALKWLRASRACTCPD